MLMGAINMDDKFNEFNEDYPPNIAELMNKITELVVLDIIYDVEQGDIDSVLNGIEYNRKMNLKSLETFHEVYGGRELDELQVSEIIGVAIAVAYSRLFLNN